jgi:hypothetical protein
MENSRTRQGHFPTTRLGLQLSRLGRVFHVERWGTAGRDYGLRGLFHVERSGIVTGSSFTIRRCCYDVGRTQTQEEFAWTRPSPASAAGSTP